MERFQSSQGQSNSYGLAGGCTQCDIKPCNGTETCESEESGSVASGKPSCVEEKEKRVLKRETSEDWFGEIGSLTDDDPPLPGDKNQKLNGTENSGQSKQGTGTEESPTCSSCNQEKSKEQRKANRPKLVQHMSWRDALKKARDMPDPWEKFHIDDSCPTEVAIRHRYNALRDSWVKDEVRIKIEEMPFDQGAMRECFRLKKLSNFSKHMNWKHAANYVCKRYIEAVSRDVYFDDVRLQMDAKLWGEEFNRYNPPKKVDIFQVYVIEMKDREGSPLYHLEHFIEGTYIKYNSNSGYVLQNETLRCTPQALSHFTFERSGHQRIVVDIQGVGDLYTDPQIHTADGTGYGEANLGPRGMALFFSSHKCNKICESLGLSAFDHSDAEIDRMETTLNNIQDSSTILKTSEECVSPGRKVSSAIFDMTEYLAQSPPPSPIISEPDSPRFSMSSSNGIYRFSRQTSDSESSETESDQSDVFTENEDEDSQKLFAAKNVHKASSVYAEVELLDKVRLEQEQKLKRQQSVSILGQVHLELAKYNEIGRFTDSEPDMDSAMFHLEQAATCGVPTALVTMAEIYLQLPHEILNSATVKESEDSVNRGVEYMLQAATLRERQAMVYMAKAFDTGTGLGSLRSRSWVEAAKWYQNSVDVVNEDDDPQNSLFTDPNYTLCAKQAQLYHQGGHGLEKDPQTAGELYSEAGDLALACMKGKLANKYYALAEEAWAEMDE